MPHQEFPTPTLPSAQDLFEAFSKDATTRRQAANRIVSAFTAVSLRASIFEDRQETNDFPTSLLLAGTKPAKSSESRASWSILLCGERTDTDSPANWRSTLRLTIHGEPSDDVRQLLDTFSSECAALATERGKDMTILAAQPTAFDIKMGMVVAGPAMRRVIHEIELYGPETAPVLITGESGTGKERIAQALHDASGRSGKKVTINCGCIPSELIASELFGFERGSFSGAQKTKRGAFEEADGGTLFLDEISSMPHAQQVALLRAVQEGTIKRIGANSEKKVNVRIVAASNAPLDELVADGRFRGDLYHRLKVLTINLPALRQRRDEIRALALHHVEKTASERGTPLTISTEALALLDQYEWPGNVRELVSCLERARIHATNGIITAEVIALQPEFADHAASTQPAELTERTINANAAVEMFPVRLDGTPLHDQLHDLEHTLVASALRATDTNVDRAASLLGLPPTTLRQRAIALGVIKTGQQNRPRTKASAASHIRPVAKPSETSAAA